MRRWARVFAWWSLACYVSGAAAQQVTAPPDAPSAPTAPPQASRDDGRAQYPAGLANSFFSLSVGYIQYDFSQRQLEPGYHAGSISVPHAAARAVLFGHHFGKHLSAQASYMRPIEYVKYRNLNGSETSQSVWMHFGTVSLLSRLPVHPRLSIYGEGGLAITNRGGFDVDEAPGMKDAHFASALLGAGLEYQMAPTLDFVAGIAHVRGRPGHDDPSTTFTSAGLRYTMRPLPAEQVAETVAAGFVFPANLIQGGYATDAFGFGVNNFVSKTVPVFWGGKVQVKRSAISLQYERNLFHTKKVFAFSLGTAFGQWRSRAGNGFHTLSVYPLARFTFLRRKPADVYASYSAAGPTYMSKVEIDGLQTGSHFTFQDFMALGVFVGQERRLNVEINLNHYSNGNIFAENAGVMIPLTLKLGYAF